MARRPNHKNFNVYGGAAIATVENAVKAAEADGAETHGEALELLAAAYLGEWD